MSPATSRDFEGKTVVVTGGARGVGRAIALRLARSRAHVIVNCFHSYDRAKALQAELAAEGLRIEIVRGSIARRDQVERLFREVEQLAGGLDCLVNNAASGAFGPVCELADDVIERALTTNLKGAWWCANEARTLMARRGGGAIVNVSSVGSGLVVGNYAAVGTSKAAIESLTRYLAAELGGEGIRVNTASGSLLQGDVARLFPDPDGMEAAVRAATPMGRLGTEEELADVVLFLLSDQAAWVTGQTLVADGGLSLGAAMLTPDREWAAKRRRAASADDPADAAAALELPPGPDLRAGVVVPDEGYDDAIAIVGAGIIVPGTNGCEEYRAVLAEGLELFVDSFPTRWNAEAFAANDQDDEDKSYQSRSAYVVGPVPDPTGLDDGSAPSVEYTARWLRHAVAEALEGVRLGSADRVGCVFGYTPDGNHHLEEALVVDGMIQDLVELLREDGRSEPEIAAVVDEAAAALSARYPRTRADTAGLWPRTVGQRVVAGILPSEPELLMVDTACSSSLYALEIGVKALRERRHDVVVCGGSFAVGPRNSVLFAKLNGLSASGHVRPLDRSSDGVLFSDGAAVVVAKRLGDARRDGDRVLGYVVATGGSSDGKGKAIYAPSVDGQRRAITRSWSKAPAAAERLSWVVAHATGTPAGDLCELTALGEEIGPDRDVWVTSNKAIIGHTGWAAGAASVIQVLLAFRDGAILPQHRYEQSPARLPDAARRLRVPTQPIPWPRDDGPRVAAVSGFGFGGTNSHVLIADSPVVGGAETAARTDTADDDALTIVAWSADFPGLADQAAVEAWLAGGTAPAQSYGAAMPTFRTLRIPPPTQRVLDRCQLMVLKCAEQLREKLGEVWDDHRETTGVFLGHMGPTRSAVAYAKRCYLDDVLSAWRPPGDLPARIRERVRQAIPASTEDSFPGMMPNVIAARVSNYFDLHGPNMVVDTGFASALDAFEIARRYLVSGDVELALVGGLNGNSTPEIRRLLAPLVGEDLEVGEGAVVFAVTTARRARAWGLPVLATIREAEADAAARPAAGAGRTYLGADGALRILDAIRTLEAAPSDSIRVVAVGDDTAHPTAVTVAATPAGAAEQASPVAERSVRRYVPRWAPADPDPVGAPIPFLPRDAVVVTATPAALGNLGDDPDDPLVLSTVACTPGPRRCYVRSISPASVRNALDTAGARIGCVRILADIEALAPAADAVSGDWCAIADLHDLSFLVLQTLTGRLVEPGSSVLGLFLGGDDGNGLHPFGGLFSGLFKSAALELPECRLLCVFTSERSLDRGREQLAVESGAKQGLPVVVYRRGRRHRLVLDDVPALRAPTAALGAGDVVLAAGGGHGIAAELLREVVGEAQPTIYVLGSTPLDELRPRLEALGGPAAIADRPTFLRDRRAADPTRTVSELNAEFERLQRAAHVLDNLAALERRCGAGRVHYRHSDVLDRTRLGSVVDEIVARHGKVDLVLHVAGVNRSSALVTKSLEAFREVRAVKVGGYCNLRAAFTGRMPRLWCNFGSFIGLTGQVGETDYASANDFLATAGERGRSDGCEEFTIGWTLWDEVGMGAHPVTRAFLAKSGVLTRMSTAEGIAHFADELHAANRAHSTFHLGNAERDAIEAKLPGFFDGTELDNPAHHTRGRKTGRFYIDRIVERGDQRLVAERLFSVERDAYLADHAVDGIGTLPGLFVPEIAAEAALDLVPELTVVGFRDIAFERFLKLVPSLTATPRRIAATVIARSAEAATVRVEITGDVTSPDSRVLQSGVRHFTATVVMAEAPPPAPIWPGLGPAEEIPVVDPYHVDGASVCLRGPFVTTRDLRMHPLGKRARYVSPVRPDDPVFGQFVVPSLLLDGLARVAVATVIENRYVPVAAPRSIRRVDLYETASDAALGSRHDALELTVTPANLSLEDPDASNRFVAATADGRMVAQMHDVKGVVLGYVDLLTGTPVARSAVAETDLRENPQPAAIVL